MSHSSIHNDYRLAVYGFIASHSIAIQVKQLTGTLSPFQTQPRTGHPLPLVSRVMGRQFRIYLAGESVYVCRQCGTHLTVSEALISKVSCDCMLGVGVHDCDTPNGERARKGGAGERLGLKEYVARRGCLT
jgi:hypothetical protein